MPQTLWLLSPELLLLLAAVVALALDRFLPRPDKQRWLPRVALGGLAGAFVATVTLWGRGPVFSALSGDRFALAVNLIALAATALVVLIAAPHIQTRACRQGAFYAVLLLATAGVCLAGAATDLVALVLALELAGACTYLLVGFLRGGPYTSEAAVKYFLYSAALWALALYGLSWLYGLGGATDLAGIAATLKESGSASRPLVLPALILATAGLAAKAAIAPFHQWAPDVYEGAALPVVAFVAIGPVTAGLAALARVLLTTLPEGALAADWRTLLIALAVLSMTAGNLLMLWQKNLRRFLAYSGIAQAGYLLVGLTAASPQGVAALLFALAAYALGNLGAFAAVAAWTRHTGSDAIEDCAGMHQRAPELAWPFALCLLSLAGVPLTAGFIGRLILFSAAVGKGLALGLLAAAGALNSVVALAGYWKVIRATFIAPSPAEQRIAPQPALMTALVIAAVGVFAGFIFSGPLLALFQAAARALFGG